MDLLSGYGSASESSSESSLSDSESDIEPKHAAPMKKPKAEPAPVPAPAPASSHLPSVEELFSTTTSTLGGIAASTGSIKPQIQYGVQRDPKKSLEPPKKATSVMMPPQMRRPNVSTEDVK
jgi:hypothetical protein